MNMVVPLKLTVEEESAAFAADERSWVCRDEQYLIWSARKKMSNAQNGIDASKAWLLTAKTLFPSDVDIHLETYRLEKSRGEMRDAANTFCVLFRDFPYDLKLWAEIKKLTAALRSNENCDDKEFYNKMFNLMPAEHQHRLLLVAAKRTENIMDHCRLMLLLLSKFHSAVLKHGVELMETILNAEKRFYENNPVNCYRKLLALDLTPKLLKSGDLQPKYIFRLFFKALEFYICYLTTGVSRIENLPENESTIQNPWENLFFVYQKSTAKLGWELSNIFENGWNKEAAWQKIRSCIRFHPQVLTSDAQCRQVVYGMSLLFLNSLHEFHEKIYEGNLVMVEIPLELYNIKESDTDRNETPSGEPPTKRRKTNEEKVIVTVTNKNIPISTFTYAFRCWDLFHSATSFEREFLKVTQTLRLEVWFKRFLQDVYLYKGSYKKCLMNLSFSESIMKRNIHLIASYFWLKEYQLMLDGIHEVVQQIRQNWNNSSPTVNVVDVANGDTKNSGSGGTNSSNSNGNVITSAQGDDFYRNENRIPPPVQSRSQRHLHFLSLTNENILKYVVKLLIIALRRSNPPLGIDSCLVDGHVLVLLQLDWPNERHIFSEIIERIQANQRFTYSLFMKYILNIDMLEEFTYLYSERGGSIPIDIMIPSSNQLINQRRMSTRGVDKGAKEDFKMAMKRQAARWTENINQIIMNFITTEKESISSCLETPPVTK